MSAALPCTGFIVRKVTADPGLLETTRAKVRRWPKMDDSPLLALSDRENILNGPVERVTRFLVEPSERATRLRQPSPFAGVLTEAERQAIYESYSDRTYHPRREPNLG